MNHQNKIRVLEGIRQGKIGGGESVLLSLVENMDKEKFEPVVLSFTEGPMVARLKNMGIPVHVIYTEKPFDISVWKKVKQLMIDERIDIVHAHGTRANSNMFWAARKLGLPLIYTSHGWSFHQDQQSLKRKIRIFGEKFLTKKATVNICVSHSNSEEGKKLFGNQFNPVVVQNSIDSKKFDPAKNYKNVREELGIASSEILFSSIARLTWQKQPVVLIKAFAEALKQVENIKLLLVGDGEEKEKVIRLVSSAGLSEKILLQNFRQDVPDVLAATDVFVLPSLWEGLPVALLEAMSMGKTILATNVDGTAEVIENGKNGLLIGTQNLEQDLTKAIVELSKDPVLRSALSREARKRATELYNVETMTRRNEEIYRQLFAK